MNVKYNLYTLKSHLNIIQAHLKTNYNYSFVLQNIIQIYLNRNFFKFNFGKISSLVPYVKIGVYFRSLTSKKFHINLLHLQKVPL